MKLSCAIWIVITVLFSTVAMAETKDFSGSYVWERTDKTVEGELAIEVDDVSDGEWSIVFSFDWEGNDHRFEGRVTGDWDGDWVGQVDSDDPGHPLKFEFEGRFSDGVFSGTHGYFNSQGEFVPSGSLTFAPNG